MEITTTSTKIRADVLSYLTRLMTTASEVKAALESKLQSSDSEVAIDTALLTPLATTVVQLEHVQRKLKKLNV